MTNVVCVTNLILVTTIEIEDIEPVNERQITGETHTQDLRITADVNSDDTTEIDNSRMSDKTYEPPSEDTTDSSNDPNPDRTRHRGYSATGTNPSRTKAQIDLTEHTTRFEAYLKLPAMESDFSLPNLTGFHNFEADDTDANDLLTNKHNDGDSYESPEIEDPVDNADVSGQTSASESASLSSSNSNFENDPALTTLPQAPKIFVYSPSAASNLRRSFAFDPAILPRFVLHTFPRNLDHPVDGFAAA